MIEFKNATNLGIRDVYQGIWPKCCVVKIALRSVNNFSFAFIVRGPGAWWLPACVRWDDINLNTANWDSSFKIVWASWHSPVNDWAMNLNTMTSSERRRMLSSVKMVKIHKNSFASFQHVSIYQIWQGVIVW